MDKWRRRDSSPYRRIQTNKINKNSPDSAALIESLRSPLRVLRRVASTADTSLVLKHLLEITS